MKYAIDLETACAVEGCPDFGKSLCSNKHSLSPWHSRITVAAIVGEDGSERIVRAETSKGLARTVQFEIEKDAGYQVVGHNFKFDWLHLARHGYEIPLERWVGDSQLAAYVLTSKIPDSWLLEYEAKRITLNKSTHRKAGKHSLKTLAPFHLGVEPFWEPETSHDDDEYVLKDTRYTLALVEKLEGLLRQKGEYDFYIERQLEWAKMLVTAELRGVEYDSERAAKMERELRNRSDELKQTLDGLWAEAHAEYVNRLRSDTFARYTEMTRAALAKLKNPDDEKVTRTIERYEANCQKALAKLPTELSYDSPTQMTWLLRDFLGYNITSLEGDETTGREVLERLSDEGHEDVKTYLEWRKANKILSAFLPTYKELSHDSVLHPIYNPDSTLTGRTSSERPNGQQVPPALRPLIKAREGYKFIGYDAAAIEAKLIALYSEDPTLHKIISSGISIHDFNVVNFFELEGVDYAEVKSKYPQHRKASKNVGFALFYNAGKNRIRIAFAQAGFIITDEQATRIHRIFKKRFEVAHQYGMQVVDYIEKGNVLENLFGRPIAVEHAEDAYMKAFNKLIQSSASDLNLAGAFASWKKMKAAGIDAIPVLFVHDFVGFEVRSDQVKDADRIIQNELTNFDLKTRHGTIRLEIEGGIMDCWEK